ncbi:hypothetical protein TRIUR3_20245 [Triticum urartu]|uniref:Uncharacterized protein n=1 Tax=Triticum urartu TaxID=4572 RepID=M7ZCQ5_TRIUA|nr:hypothetical protein TRIUR3_20245 [Triticum urartu]
MGRLRKCGSVKFTVFMIQVNVLSFTTVKQLVGVVQSPNADKPDVSQGWSKSLVIKVLDCLVGPSFKVSDGFSPRMNAEVNFQNISSTPT